MGPHDRFTLLVLRHAGLSIAWMRAFQTREGQTSTGRAVEIISKSYERSRLHTDADLGSGCRQTSVGQACLHNVKSPPNLGFTT